MRRLMDGNTSLKIPGQIANISILQVPCLKLNVAAIYRDVLNEFPSLTRSSIALKDIQYGISHAIVTQEQPVTTRAHRLASEKLKATKLEFEFMLQQRLCRHLKAAGPARYI